MSEGSMGVKWNVRRVYSSSVFRWHFYRRRMCALAVCLAVCKIGWIRLDYAFAIAMSLYSLVEAFHFIVKPSLLIALLRDLQGQVRADILRLWCSGKILWDTLVESEEAGCMLLASNDGLNMY